MEVKFGSLFVDKKPYEKKVKEPKHRDLLEMCPNEIDETLQRPTYRADSFVQDGNTFIGYTAMVNSPKDVQDTYHKIRLIHPGARHVVCAYILQGLIKHENEDFCDDEETNAGRIILQEMIRNEWEARAIYVVRYSGSKMGGERLNAYLKATRYALAAPYNILTNKKEKVKTPVPKPFPKVQREMHVPDDNAEKRAFANKQVPAKQRGYIGPGSRCGR